MLSSQLLRRPTDGSQAPEINACEHRPNPAARAGRKRWRGSQKLLADGSLVHSPGWLVVRAGSSS